MESLFLSAWRSGIRAHSVRWLLLIALAILGVAWLAANFSARHPATVALDVGISGIRLVLMLMALFWVQELLGKDIERKSLYFILAYPISRGTYLLSRFLAVAALLLLGVCILGLSLGIVLHNLPVSYQQATPIALGGPYLLVLLGVWLDLLVITAFALWVCSISTTPFLPLILGFAFAIGSRMLGSTLDFLLHSKNAQEAHTTFLLPILQYAKWLLPDLSRLDWREIALYGVPPNWKLIGFGSLMAVCYCGLLLLMGRRNLIKRELL